ncbi:MAG TPA: class I adenylate-forming enzyme family protein, partial [Clostridia bacterium]|nr:class I adenylate-forming enzyme family protein [Clostridia bacterium]
IALIGGYGITECSPLVSVNPDSFNDYRTAGCRLACVDWKIDEPSAEGIGEILVRGDIVMMGYYKMPEKTAEVLRDGWFYTGDYGYITLKDQLVITGRKKNLIILSNGKNIYPEELENEILSIPEVQEVVVRAIKDDKGNEKSLMAEVFLAKEYPLQEEELLKKIQTVLADKPLYKRINQLVIRDVEFPKTTSKKIKR